MSRGFICDGCGNATKGEPMLEIDLSASIKTVSGNSRREPHTEELHYCQTCVAGRAFERGEFQPRVEHLIHGCIAASSWNWGSP